MSDFPHTWFQTLITQLSAQRHRLCLVLKGDEQWRRQWVRQALSHTPDWQGLNIGHPDSEPMPQAHFVPAASLSQHLGQETDFALLMSEQGIDANALGQVSGMIRAGGICWIGLDTEWESTPNPANHRFLSTPFSLTDSQLGFNRFLWQQLLQHACVVEQDTPLPEKPFLAENASAPSTVSMPDFKPSSEQQSAMEAVHSVAFGHRKRPLVIDADRGRGKSTLLGMAAIELLENGKHHIGVAAARVDQTKLLFEAAATMVFAQGWHLTEHSNGHLAFNLNGQLKSLRFYAPDELIAGPALQEEIDVLMVDEAAHLPMPMLLDLVGRYHRLVLATTQQGYEGSGRSFTLRFQRELDRLTPDWKSISLRQPIRWNDGDPLERTVNHALLLDAEDDLPTTESPIPLDKLNYRPVSIAELLQTPTLLAQIFRLLVTAHYQTSPNDLMQLLETPNQFLWVATANATQVLGVLFALEEGNLMASNISHSDTNPHRAHGHLFPQLLARQSGEDDWLKHKTCRIVRLAVHPSYQSQRIGSSMLQAFKDHIETSQAFDSLSTSFGATPRLADFWLTNGLMPLHLGSKRDKSSGTHSLAMILPITERSRALADRHQRRFSRQFAWHLTQLFNTLAPKMVLKLIAALPYDAAEFPQGYLTGSQPFEAVSYELREWSLRHTTALEHLTDGTRTAWVRLILQHQLWQAVVAETQFASRKALEAAMKTDIKKALHMSASSGAIRRD